MLESSCVVLYVGAILAMEPDKIVTASTALMVRKPLSIQAALIIIACNNSCLAVSIRIKGLASEALPFLGEASQVFRRATKFDR
jgi:hypothetical protein